MLYKINNHVLCNHFFHICLNNNIKNNINSNVNFTSFLSWQVIVSSWLFIWLAVGSLVVSLFGLVSVYYFFFWQSKMLHVFCNSVQPCLFRLSSYIHEMQLSEVRKMLFAEYWHNQSRWSCLIVLIISAYKCFKLKSTDPIRQFI